MNNKVEGHFGASSIFDGIYERRRDKNMPLYGKNTILKGDLYDVRIDRFCSSIGDRTVDWRLHYDNGHDEAVYEQEVHQEVQQDGYGSSYGTLRRNGGFDLKGARKGFSFYFYEISL